MGIDCDMRETLCHEANFQEAERDELIKKVEQQDRILQEFNAIVVGTSCLLGKKS